MANDLSATVRLPEVAPAAVGVAVERLGRMHDLIQSYVDRGLLAGAITLVARDGMICDVHAYGWQDREAMRPMERTALFRVASLTKLVTAVAALKLWEGGRLALDDAVGDLIPALRNMRVATGGGAAAPGLAVARPITFRHLLTHTAGFQEGWPTEFIERPPASLHEFVTALAGQPLVAQPGDRFIYGCGYEVLAYLIEVVSGQPFDCYIRNVVSGPLGLSDTCFQVPPAKQARLARTYVHDPGRYLVARPVLPSTYHLGGLGMPRGGGGLVTTIDDYARFAQMLLNRGELDGVRILDRKTVELMSTDQLGNLRDPNAFLPPFESYGFGVGVQTRGGDESMPGAPGQFGWTGAATTYCSVDPQERTVALFFAQHYPWNEYDLFGQFSKAFYGAISRRNSSRE